VAQWLHDNQCKIWYTDENTQEIDISNTKTGKYLLQNLKVQNNTLIYLHSIEQPTCGGIKANYLVHSSNYSAPVYLSLEYNNLIIETALTNIKKID
jgi:hypothetical protein